MELIGNFIYNELGEFCKTTSFVIFVKENKQKKRERNFIILIQKVLFWTSRFFTALSLKNLIKDIKSDVY